MVKCCTTKTLVQPEGLQVFRRVCWHPYLLYIYILLGHTNKTFPFIMLNGMIPAQFRNALGRGPEYVRGPL